MVVKDVRLLMRWRLGLHTAIVFAESEVIRVNEDKRPLLSEHCSACHWPELASRKAKLRLDTYDGASRAGVITRGKAADSELTVRTTNNDPKEMRPPTDRPRPHKHIRR